MVSFAACRKSGPFIGHVVAAIRNPVNANVNIPFNGVLFVFLTLTKIIIFVKFVTI